MLEKIKLLLNQANTDDEDELLVLLINLAKEEAYNYCNLEEYNTILDYIVIQMVIEKYNRIGSEGLTSQSTSGVEAVYDSSYSQKVIKMLNKHRKVKTI